jgi:hypothetical protein
MEPNRCIAIKAFKPSLKYPLPEFSSANLASDNFNDVSVFEDRRY